MTEDTAKIQTMPASWNQPPMSEATALIHMIERVARDVTIPIERIERLIEMRNQAEERAAKRAFDLALSEMQPKLPVVGRMGKIEVREKTTGGKRDGELIQSTKYALWEDINEAIRPMLSEHGFALSFRSGQAPDGKITVTGILSHREGHREDTTIILMHDSTGSKNSVQAVGSSISYGKRYTAMMLLNITSRGEDDDGKKAGDAAKISESQIADLIALAEDVGADKDKFCKFMKIDSFADLPASRFKQAVDALNAKRKKA